jgi:hypothetical protein
LAEPVSVSLCGQILLYQHTSRSLYPPRDKFEPSNPKEQKSSRAANQPSLSTQRTSTTSTSSSSTSSTCGSPCSTPGAWFVSTKMKTTQDEFDYLLSFLSKYGLEPYRVQRSPALGFQQFMVKMNDTLASDIQKLPAVS